MAASLRVRSGAEPLCGGAVTADAPAEITMVLGLAPPRVLSASAEAAVLFGTGDLGALTRIVFGSPSETRRLDVRLDRLESGSPPHLERIVVVDRFHRFGVTVGCDVVSGRPDKTVRMRVAPVPAWGSLGRERAMEQPSRHPDRQRADLVEPAVSTLPREPVVPEAVVEHASHQERRAVPRFVWSTDAAGLVTHVGGEMAACFGAAALQEGDELAARLGALSPAAADTVAEAVAVQRGWAGLPVAWPPDDGGPALTVVLAGTPSPGRSGYRGFGLILGRVAQGESAEAPENSSAESPPIDVVPDEIARPAVECVPADETAARPESVLTEAEPAREAGAADPAPEAMEASSPEPAGSADRDALPAAASPDGLIDTDVPSEDRLDRDNRPGIDTQNARIMPFPGFSSSGASKVVHLSTFKTGAPVLSGKALSRLELVRPGEPELKPNALEAPQWAEAPDASPPKVAPDQRLSSHERFNFDEIARALAALPTADTAGLVGASTRADASADEAATLAPPARLVDETAAGHAAPAGGPSDAWAILECLAVGILVVRAETVVYANRALLDLTGFGTVADLQAVGLGSLLRGQDGGRPTIGLGTQSFALATRGGKSLEVDARIQKIVWGDEPATLMSVRRANDEDARARLAAVGLDLRRSQALASDLADALDLAASGAGFLDANGRILSISRGAERLFGYDQREIVGDAGTALVASEDQAAWTTFFQGFASATGQSRTAAFRKFAGRRRQGGTIPVAVSLRRIEADRICVIWQESHHGHATASELDALRREAERSSALKSEFLAKVSHEIRTPLNAILGFTEIIIEERFGPIVNDRYREYLKDIHTSGTHVVSLINDLLDLSRIEAGGLDLNPVPVNVNLVLGECVGTLQGQAHRDRIIVRTSFAARAPIALADERAFRQIALNLLSNALKFNEPGGQVIVSTAITESGQVVVRVRDTGLGMTQDEVETAMKPFRQLATPRATSGTGLGLPLTKAMIEANNGHLKIESRPREGTLVEVRLPAAPASLLSLPAE